MLDKYDCDKFAAVYRLLADILEREPPADRTQEHMSYRLGDLAGRLFIGTPYDPPDEVLEATATTLRGASEEDRRKLARRLRENADHLDRHRAVDMS
jgi:hypothetical protein